MHKRFSRWRVLLLTVALAVTGCEQEEEQTAAEQGGCSACCQAPSRDAVLSPVAAPCCEGDQTEAVSQQEPAAGDQKPVTLNVGDMAPNFQGLDDEGKPFKLSDHVGKRLVVVYFYPADFTGVCTAQACAFRDDFPKLVGKDVTVIGVSGDAVKTHALFKREHKLNFTLVSDPRGEIAEKFGVPTKPGATLIAEIGGKKLDFTRGITIERWTFVIGTDGKILYKNTQVEPKQDTQKILKLIEQQGK
jgi:peroxiredoxin Q/BCP